MIIAYRDPETKLLKKIAASISTKHAGSGDSRPVIVLSTGEIVDTLTWNLRECQVVQATQQERHPLAEILNRGEKGSKSA